MPIRFAFLTDTHHYPDAPEDYGAPKMLTRSQEVLDAIPPALNAQAFRLCRPRRRFPLRRGVLRPAHRYLFALD